MNSTVIHAYRNDVLANAELWLSCLCYGSVLTVVLFIWVSIWKNRGQL